MPSARRRRRSDESGWPTLSRASSARSRALIDGVVVRLAIGGGETSGAVVTALGLDYLMIGPEIDPGVPTLASRTKAGKPLRLALKGRNFGAADFYAKALRM